MKAGRFYLLSGLFFLSALCWMMVMLSPLGEGDWSICFFKNISGISCPACGSTTAVMHLFRGNVTQALLENPLGLAVALTGLVALLIWISDRLQKKILLFECYQRFELMLKKPLPLIGFMSIILINWLWKMIT